MDPSDHLHWAVLNIHMDYTETPSRLTWSVTTSEGIKSGRLAELTYCFNVFRSHVVQKRHHILYSSAYMSYFVIKHCQCLVVQCNLSCSRFDVL